MPEITTVSKPNSSPPSAPVRVAFIRFRLGRMRVLVNHSYPTDPRRGRTTSRPPIRLLPHLHPPCDSQQMRCFEGARLHTLLKIPSKELCDRARLQLRLQPCR